jgi:hypothetical protein
MTVLTREYNVTDENFLLLAMKAYEKPNAIMSEFAEDYKHIKYVKRQIGKYLSSGTIRTRLILNHIIILSNVFGVDFSTRLLYLKLDKAHYPALKTFLVYLSHEPIQICWINGEIHFSSDVAIDMTIADELRKI